MVDIYDFAEEETDKLIQEYQQQLQTMQNERGNIKDFLKQLRKEELEHMHQQWELAKEKGEASGRPPETISPNRCAVLLNKHLTFILFDIEEGTKLAFYMQDEGIYTQNYTYIKRIISWLEPKHNQRRAEDVIFHLTNMVNVVPRTNEPHLIPVRCI